MKAFTLTLDDFVGVLRFLHATKLVGMDEALFRPLTDADLPRVMASLEAQGLLEPAERPGSFHIDADLMQTLAVATSPDIAVLARSTAQGKSVVFYLADTGITEIVVTNDSRVLVVKLEGIDALSEQAVELLNGACPCDLIVARVKGDGFDAGHHAAVDADGSMHTKSPGLLKGAAFSAENVSAFVRGAIADLDTDKRVKPDSRD